jgi:hypothetical protein
MTRDAIVSLEPKTILHCIHEGEIVHNESGICSVHETSLTRIHPTLCFEISIRQNLLHVGYPILLLCPFI